MEIINIQCKCCGEYIPVNSEKCPFCGEEVSRNEQNETDIKCVFCGEYIPEESEKCPFCGENVIKIHHKGTALKKDNKRVNLELKKQRIKRYKKYRKYRKIIISSVLFIFIFLIILITAMFVLHKFNPKISLPEKFLTIKDNNQNIDVKSVKLPDCDIEKAKKLFNQEKYDEAALIFDNLAKNENNAEAYYYLGKIYNQREYTKLAIKNFKAAESENHNYIEPKIELAKLYFNDSDYDSAIKYAKEILSLQPKNIEILEMLYSIYEDRNDSDNLKDVCQNIIKVKKGHYNANYYLADYYYKKSNIKQAVLYLENILEAEYDRNIAYSLISLYSDIEYYTRAIEIADIIIKNDSSEINRAKNIKEKLEFYREQYKMIHSENKPVTNE